MKITKEQLESLRHMQSAVRYIIGNIERGEMLDPNEAVYAKHMLACAKALDAVDDRARTDD
jgi:hypothetical protein